MDPSSLNWSKQLRRDAPLSSKHTVSSIQKAYHCHNRTDQNMQKRYQRPPRISELVKEIRYLKQEAMEKITLENESQKTFESIQKQMDLLRNCFESFTSMIVDECEDLRNDQLKAFEDINEAENKYSNQMHNAFRPICDNMARSTSMKLLNLQNQINDLRNLILLNNKEKESVHRRNYHKCNNDTPRTFEHYQPYQQPPTVHHVETQKPPT